MYPLSRESHNKKSSGSEKYFQNHRRDIQFLIRETSRESAG